MSATTQIVDCLFHSFSISQQTHKMNGRYPFLLVVFASFYLAIAQNPPIMIAFHWHLHQPIYFPVHEITRSNLI